MSPKETMKYAQQLYEEGYITYMRTDSKKYSQEFVDNVKKFIISNHGEQFINKTIDLLVVGNQNENNNTNLNDTKIKKNKKTVAEKKRYSSSTRSS